MASILDILPEEMVIAVFQHAGDDGRYMAALTCKELNRIMPYMVPLDICVDAVSAGHLEILVFLGDWVKCCASRVLDVAVIGGHIPCVDYVLDNSPIKVIPLHIAAKYGHLDMIRYYYRKGVQLTADMCEYAIIHDQMDVVKYLSMFHIRGVNMTHDAIYYGKLEILVWLLNNGGVLCYDAHIIAIITGRPHILEYLHENGYPCPIRVWEPTIMYDRIPIAKYLIKSGVVLCTPCNAIARQYGSQEMIELLESAGYVL